MDRFAAHYIFTGNNVLRKAVLAQDNRKKIVSLSSQDAMAIEYSNTIFFNGIICPAFCAFEYQSVPENFSVVQLHKKIPELRIDPAKLVIAYQKGEEKDLFAFFLQLQNKFGYSIFDLLKAVCVNNYIAQQMVAPVIQVENRVPLILLTRLNLVEGIFQLKTLMRPL